MGTAHEPLQCVNETKISFDEQILENSGSHVTIIDANTNNDVNLEVLSVTDKIIESTNATELEFNGANNLSASTHSIQHDILGQQRHIGKPFFTSLVADSNGSDRWKFMSNLAGKHAQPIHYLDLSNRGSIVLAAMEYGIPQPFISSQITTLNCTNNELSTAQLPKVLGVILHKFPNLRHLFLKDNPCYILKHPGLYYNQAGAQAEVIKMMRLYVLNRIPYLETLDGISVTESERNFARPFCPNGVALSGGDRSWLTGAMRKKKEAYNCGEEVDEDIGMEVSLSNQNEFAATEFGEAATIYPSIDEGSDGNDADNDDVETDKSPCESKPFCNISRYEVKVDKSDCEVKLYGDNTSKHKPGGIYSLNPRARDNDPLDVTCFEISEDTVLVNKCDMESSHLSEMVNNESNGPQDGIISPDDSIAKSSYETIDSDDDEVNTKEPYTYKTNKGILRRKVKGRDKSCISCSDEEDLDCDEEVTLELFEEQAALYISPCSTMVQDDTEQDFKNSISESLEIVDNAFKSEVIFQSLSSYTDMDSNIALSLQAMPVISNIELCNIDTSACVETCVGDTICLPLATEIDGEFMFTEARETISDKKIAGTICAQSVAVKSKKDITSLHAPRHIEEYFSLEQTASSNNLPSPIPETNADPIKPKQKSFSARLPFSSFHRHPASPGSKKKQHRPPISTLSSIRSQGGRRHQSPRLRTRQRNPFSKKEKEKHKISRARWRQRVGSVPSSLLGNDDSSEDDEELNGDDRPEG